MEGRKKELEAFLADAEEPPPLLHPGMAGIYRAQVAELYDAPQEDVEAKRLKAAEALRSLVKEIILTPADGALAVDVRGDLAEILATSTKKDPPPLRREGRNLRWVRGHATPDSCDW
jgi:site-specific DNA recombinase